MRRVRTFILGRPRPLSAHRRADELSNPYTLDCDEPLNRREYELTKNVSLLQLAPLELIRLRSTGRATVTIPEELFDLDTPGHYFRRLRSLAVSIPCITGPYTGVACTARLLRSHVRTSHLLNNNNYSEDTDADERFDHQLGATEAIVTSSGSIDSGLFDPSLRDERLLPFEYRGAAGEWQLELASDPRPFDYNTITDVVLHLRYTARDGGQQLREAASENLKKQIAAGTAAGCARLLSVRHEFPSEWARFTAATAGPGTLAQPRAGLTLNLRREHYPFFAGAGAGPAAVLNVELLARPIDKAISTVKVVDRAVDDQNQTRSVTLNKRADLGDLLWAALDDGTTAAPGWAPLPAPTGAFNLFTDSRLADLFVVITWK